MKALRYGIILMVCLFGFNFSAFADVKKMTFMCEDKEDFPALMGNTAEIEKTKPGVAVEILRMAGKKLGVTIEIKRAPWKRALEIDLKNDAVDGLFTASYKKEREEFGSFPMKDGQIDKNRKFSNVTYVFYRQKGTTVDYDGKELKNLKGKIGAPRGYSIVDDLQKKGYQVEESSSTLSDLNKLSKGRIGAVAALELTGEDILKTNPDLAGAVEKISTPISTKGYFFMLSHKFAKENPEFAEKFWSTIAELSSKNYQDLVKKYLH
jgi:polar amino acid transport system substrate-binding protein